jgi:hypothetical protein
MEYGEALQRVQDSDPELRESLRRIEMSVGEAWRVPYMPWFTDHGPTHSRRVVQYLLHLVPSALSIANDLTPLEIYIACAAAWTHDLGMQVLLQGRSNLGELTSEDYDAVRSDHPRQSYGVLIAKGPELGLPDDPEVITAVALVAEAHGTKFFVDSIAKLGKIKSVRNQPVRVQLLAALLLFADELDMHYERARFPDPTQASLSATSRAHNFKHHYISRVDIQRTAIGETEFCVGFTFPIGVAMEDRHSVVRWVTAKLQTQIGLIHPHILKGFAGQLRFSRAIRVSSDEELAPTRRLVDSEALQIIHEDNAKTQIVDHRESLRSLSGASRSFRVLGVLGRRDADSDGREDILDWLRLKLASQRQIVASDRLRNLMGGSPSDVLGEWLKAFGVEPTQWTNESQQRSESLKTLIGYSAAAGGVVFMVSSLDSLGKLDEAWMLNRCAQDLLSNFKDSVFAFTSDLDATWSGSAPSYLLRLGSPNSEEVAEYFRRFHDDAQGEVYVGAGLEYNTLKRIAAQQELKLMERATSV